MLLLDRRTFPRPKACACGLTRKTLAALRYSVAPMIERECSEIVLQQASEDAARCEVRVRTRSPICAMAVRERFDAFCLQQTLAAGAKLQKIEGIVALRETGDGVELDVGTAEGEETLRAAVLIGADGSNGQTRRLSQPTEAAWYTRGFALEACVPYAELPAKLPGGGEAHDLVFDFAPLQGGYGWLFPKGNHINIGVAAFAPEADEAQLKQVTRDLLTGYVARRLGVANSPPGAILQGSILGWVGTPTCRAGACCSRATLLGSPIRSPARGFIPRLSADRQRRRRFLTPNRTWPLLTPDACDRCKRR